MNESVRETSQLIEFDGMQLEIRTRIPTLQDFVRMAYEHMIVSKLVSPVGTISITESDAGYVLTSSDQVVYRRDQLDILLDMLRDEVHLRFMKARPDLLWLHAAVVEKNGEALLISGPSGQGKSTLSTRLCERGWRILSDDIAPTSMDADIVFPFPQTPRRRLFPGAMIDPYKIHTLDREQVVIGPHEILRGPVRVGAIAYVEFVLDRPPSLERLTRGSAALELLKNSVNFVDHKEAAVSRAASLGNRIPAFKLCYDSVTTAVESLESLL